MKVAGGESNKLRLHETFDAAAAPVSAPDVSVASEEVGALLQESADEDREALEGQAWSPMPEPEDQGSFWPWFHSLSKYKRGSYKDAAERIRAYRDSAKRASEPTVMSQQEQESSFWPWFNSLTKYKRGSYSEAAARIRAYRAAKVKVVVDDTEPGEMAQN